MRRLYRMTLQRPEMDSQGKIAPTRVSLTSSRPQELLIGQQDALLSVSRWGYCILRCD
jgi:hypothetical protein